MLNRHMYLGDASQQALGFLQTQTTHIETTVYQIRYPDIQYPGLIPVDTSAPEWTKSVTFYSTDKVGQAEFFHAQATDIPIADVTREKFEVGIEMAAIGYRYNLEELAQAQKVGVPLTAERAGAARRAYEEFVDIAAFSGYAIKGWSGLLNYPGITVVELTADGEGDVPYWSAKTADQILRDINSVLIGVWTGSRTIEMADTLLLPPEQFAALATLRIPETTMTILQFLQQYNAYTAQTGQPLTIRAVRGLESAGEGGVGRLIAYRRDPQVLKLHLPMPHRFLPIWPRTPLVFDVPGIFRLGGLEIRLPAAVRYADGLSPMSYE